MSFSLDSRIILQESRRVVPKTIFERQHPRSSLIVLLISSNIIGRRSDQSDLDEVVDENVRRGRWQPDGRLWFGYVMNREDGLVVETGRT